MRNIHSMAKSQWIQLAMALLALTSSHTTNAQALEKPIRLVVPYAPGGPIDVTARALAERVKDSLGVVIIDNKPGAGGNLGVDIVAKAPADGYTILFTYAAAHVVNPVLLEKMPYDVSKDFVAIAQIGAGGQRQAQDPGVPAGARQQVRRVVDGVLGVHVGTAFDQPARRLQPVGGGGAQQRRAAGGVALVDRGAGGSQALQLGHWKR